MIVHSLFVATVTREDLPGMVEVLLVEAESSAKALQECIKHVGAVQAAIQVKPYTQEQSEERPQ